MLKKYSAVIFVCAVMIGMLFLGACKKEQNISGVKESVTEKSPETAEKPDTFTPEEKGDFFEAAKTGDTQTIMSFIKRGIDVNMQFFTQHSCGYTALIAAIIYKNNDAVRILLDAGANPNIQDEDNRTALIHASEVFSYLAAFDRDIIKAMLEAGADPNIKDSWGRTALMGFAQNDYRCDQDVITMLLEAGADPELQDNDGNTALISCTPYQDPEY